MAYPLTRELNFVECSEVCTKDDSDCSKSNNECQKYGPLGRHEIFKIGKAIGGKSNSWFNLLETKNFPIYSREAIGDLYAEYLQRKCNTLIEEQLKFSEAQQVGSRKRSFYLPPKPESSQPDSSRLRPTKKIPEQRIPESDVISPLMPGRRRRNLNISRRTFENSLSQTDLEAKDDYTETEEEREFELPSQLRVDQKRSQNLLDTAEAKDTRIELFSNSQLRCEKKKFRKGQREQFVWGERWRNILRETDEIDEGTSKPVQISKPVETPEPVLHQTNRVEKLLRTNGVLDPTKLENFVCLMKRFIPPARYYPCQIEEFYKKQNLPFKCEAELNDAATEFSNDEDWISLVNFHRSTIKTWFDLYVIFKLEYRPELQQDACPTSFGVAAEENLFEQQYDSKEEFLDP